MSKPAENRLYNLEITPPARVWESIAGELEQLASNPSTETADRLYQYTIEPPASAWNNIRRALEFQPKKLFVLNWRKLAAAAVIIGLSATAIIYFVNRRGSNENLVQQIPARIQPPAIVVPDNKSTESVKENNANKAELNLANVAKMVRKKPVQKQSSNSTANTLIVEEDYKHDPDYYISNAVVNDLAAPKPFIEAPPIRDGEGNIVMDMDLVYSADKKYIIVTGPNGEQTRISAKFEKFIPYLNAGANKDEYLNPVFFESTMWKIVFDNWRSRLLSSASFAPSGGNFLDIFELKKLIEENQ